MQLQCSVCGGTTFKTNKVLWPKLIEDWQLLPDEVDYVDKQQGTCCDSCGANVRSIALANAIRSFINTPLLLKDLTLKEFSILEINEAGTLSPTLENCGERTFGAYPDIDMLALPYEDNTFDMVVHSDTLEHIVNPTRALSECYRVLKPGGGLCFTVPTIIGRMTRCRDGLPNSYHGTSELAENDFIVHTEFGADAWLYILEAGFTELSIHTFAFPAGIAYSAKKPQQSKIFETELSPLHQKEP